MKGVIYARYSSDNQREESIEGQIRECKYDTTKLVHRRRLIDSFVNAIYLYDDRITLVFNFKDGTKTITFAELEESGLGSDINALAAPYRVSITDLSFRYSIFFCFHALFPCIEQVRMSLLFLCYAVAICGTYSTDTP